jgi:SagB-type dehydrogenase family enzyme
MNEQKSLTPEEIAQALVAVKTRIEEERRAQFSSFGIPVDCLWPASRLFHEHSSLGPAWIPALTIEEVATLTKNPVYKVYPAAERTRLPHPPPLSRNLEETIRLRRSAYEFSKTPLKLPQLAKLLELSSGITALDEIPRRAAPSGGALYPVETYVLCFGINDLPHGLYHYLAPDHLLEHLRSFSGIEVTKPFLPPRLFDAGPSAVLVLSIIFARTQQKYLERGYRFALLEAGHIAQNIILTATALGLNSVSVGGFWDEPFNELMGFNSSEEAVVYAVLLGQPG